jgi:hypothetical protein
MMVVLYGREYWHVTQRRKKLRRFEDNGIMDAADLKVAQPVEKFDSSKRVLTDRDSGTKGH